MLPWTADARPIGIGSKRPWCQSPGWPDAVKGVATGVPVPWRLSKCNWATSRVLVCSPDPVPKHLPRSPDTIERHEPAVDGYMESQNRLQLIPISIRESIDNRYAIFCNGLNSTSALGITNKPMVASAHIGYSKRRVFDPSCPPMVLVQWSATLCKVAEVARDETFIWVGPPGRC
eukprot:1741174-Amphidinium_carterae.4